MELHTASGRGTDQSGSRTEPLCSVPFPPWPALAQPEGHELRYWVPLSATATLGILHRQDDQLAWEELSLT